MLKKSYSKTGSICRVTFKYENHEAAKHAVLAGDFNGWSLKKTPMKKIRAGGFSVTISLGAGQSYQFRYVLDGKLWANDSAADSYLPNGHGECNSVVTV